ncbi:hypothetical protein K2173_010200 [Erythroxylum novogranatense]|uniref:Nudix hydrolase domain-containing protein n=1 Tax=Erythroxylum novogranatense TaxID=1862640 RepID=A0AAV8SRF9_9ROSI|nr:hypothetical protein K2173_010200 [Erythroxylum novogranatense]
MVCCGGYVRNPNPCIYEIGGRNHLSRFAEFAKVPLVVTCNLTETPPDGYRRNVGICLVNSSRKIFTASRINIRNTWQMPQVVLQSWPISNSWNYCALCCFSHGGADDGEDLRKAAMRELREETGVTSAEFLAEAPYWLTYDFPMQVRYRLNRRWGTNYKGQAQKWATKVIVPFFIVNAFFFHVEQAVYFKKPVYQQVMKIFSPHLLSDVGEGIFCANDETKVIMSI